MRTVTYNKKTSWGIALRLFSDDFSSIPEAKSVTAIQDKPDYAHTNTQDKTFPYSFLECFPQVVIVPIIIIIIIIMNWC